jgi:diguanylate cyclase (GGDEF)-like protein/PAS domain S-box-containing protein
MLKKVGVWGYFDAPGGVRNQGYVVHMRGERGSTAARLLSTQRAINSHLAALKPPEQLVPDLIRTICETLDWTFGAFWAPAGEGDHLELAAVWHEAEAGLEEFTAGSRAYEVRPGHGLLGTVWDRGTPVWLRDLREAATPRSRTSSAAGFASVFALPLISNGSSFGILEFQSLEEREPDPELIDNFQLIGTQLAQYLERWDALAEQRRLAAIVESSDDAILSKDRNLIITSWNRGAERLYGYSAEEAIGHSVTMLIPDDRVGEEAELLDRVTRGERVSRHETRRLRKDGSIVDVSITASPVLDAEGNAVGASVIAHDITERVKSEAAVAHLAYHDQVTGLPNRVLLEEHLEIGLARAVREGRELALLCLDLDNFKMVNDSLGHAAGDRLLEMVAERFVSVTRVADVVARHGGDEFLVLLSDLGSRSVEVAQTVAAKILDALGAPFTVGDAEFEMSASVGIAVYPRDGETSAALIRAADSAMYQAKASGRGSYALYPGGSGSDPDLLSVTARLRRAVTQEELVLHYQPIFRVPDRRLVAVEALVRWNDPARGLVGPGEFVALAEDTGLIEPIGEWVIRDICRQALEWSAAGLDVRIHFNLSPRQLRQRDVADTIRATIESGGVAPEALTAEITESAAMAEAELGHSILNELRALGLHLSVDDFGSGYSSLGRLHQLPVDELKLDRSFLQAVPHDVEAGALVRGVLDLAQGLGMDTVVEGVETDAQWEFLVRHGSALAQGFHLARPAPAHQITAMLERARRAA